MSEMIPWYPDILSKLSFISMQICSLLCLKSVNVNRFIAFILLLMRRQVLVWLKHAPLSSTFYISLKNIILPHNLIQFLVIQYISVRFVFLDIWPCSALFYHSGGHSAERHTPGPRHPWADEDPGGWRESVLGNSMSMSISGYTLECSFLTPCCLH